MDYVEQHEQARALRDPLWAGPCQVEMINAWGLYKLQDKGLTLPGWFHASQLRISQLLDESSSGNSSDDSDNSVEIITPPAKIKVARRLFD